MVCSKLSARPCSFEVPPLKVGTLDNLMECSDDLFKIDTQVEGVTFKILHILEDISGSSDLAVVTKAGAQGQQISEPTDEYLANFRWNEAQLPINKPLKTLIQQILETVMKAEENIRTKLQDYNEIRTKLQNIKKKSGGSLAVKPVATQIKEWYKRHQEDGPIETEALTTLFVAVPSSDEKKWLKEYATLGGTPLAYEASKGVMTEMSGIVPDSSKLIARESDYCLFNVILMRKVVDSYKQALRENKIIVREYLPEEEVSDEALQDLNTQADTKKNNLVRWLKNAFSECYGGWIHLKAIRVFVESILRYGLPPNFVAMLFNVDSKKEKDARKQLGVMYASLSPKKYGLDEETDSFQALEQQYPYVSLKVKANAHDN
eukprot:CAMPEP_0174287608 /NCGR_PEP_ID=MMETSP0809-20121228/16585_1 /TAXON_ID=73025 ORGANISM="Eutreptiella gymnastica-like, Strain CCMP1594" /NCGR_SAMPLE_ID=MMETSP0809 /ASSEMBLY_ACC=CAM_ASM_000658 /LENGTH=375 /DNA_ID=CAMNT_0015384245 /DNA_START=116 /DNA_END=1243 /DNA_ORIENTATION=-